MIFGRRYWIWIWYGIFLLGLLGLVASIYWGKRTHYRNLEEIFRAIGTILVSLGMVLLLRGVLIILGQAMMVLALACFITAFILGRRAEARGEPVHSHHDED
jgi:Ca2+/Na+ antiporter